jgi:hypothetical protein
MSSNIYRESAKIYQFPTRARRVADRLAGADAADLMSQRISDAIGACWYHEAAIKQAAGSTKP